MSLNGGDGDDTVITPAIMDNRDGETPQDTLTGGHGDDNFIINLNFDNFENNNAPADEINIATITDFNRGDNTLTINSDNNDTSGLAFDGLELRVAEDGSYTDVIARYTSLTSGVGLALAVIRLEGVDDLSLNDINLGGDVGTAGDDFISSGGRIGAVTEISGGAGDDLLLHEGRDDAGRLILGGATGNDTLIADDVEFNNATTLDGGAGDDLLVTQLFTRGGTDSVDTFITGTGADTIGISTAFNIEGDEDYGIMARVTDFTPGEDMIVIDTTPLSDGSAGTFTQTVTLTENIEGNYTDVSFVVTNAETESSFSGVVRLEGLTGLSDDDIAVSLSDGVNRLADVSANRYTEATEVRV